MDWFGNITAERVLSNTTDKWNYPDLYHTFTVKCSDGGETLQVIMVRSQSLQWVARIQLGAWRTASSRLTRSLTLSNTALPIPFSHLPRWTR